LKRIENYGAQRRFTSKYYDAILPYIVKTERFEMCGQHMQSYHFQKYLPHLLNFKEIVLFNTQVRDDDLLNLESTKLEVFIVEYYNERGDEILITRNG